jgi:MoaA/NifB/PqqE/SkfB family radical SAM enzyme
MKLKKIMLELCNTCNYDCVFCRSGRDKKAILRLNDFKDFDYYIQAADNIDITGYGEITTHPDFKEIIETISKYNKKIQMSTNGSLLTDEIITILENSTLSILNISLNSLNKEIYHNLTGGNLDIVLSNIDKLFTSKLKTDKLFDKSSRYLQCSFVINQLNFYEIKDFIDFGIKHDIDISLKDLTPAIKDYDPILIIEDNRENRSHINDCLEYGKRHPGKVHFFNIDNRSKENFGKLKNDNKISRIIQGCEYIDNIIAINHAGGVKACCWMPKTELGNVKENTLDEIMNSEIYNDLRENIRIGSKKYCSDCRRLG